MKNGTVTILGAGTWGITLAHLLAQKDIPVNVWDISADIVQTLNKYRIHPKLLRLHISNKITISTNFEEMVNDAEFVIVVVPSNVMRETAERLKDIKDVYEKNFIICSKGIEENSLMTMSQVLIDVLGEEARDRIAVLSGPSHAEEVAAQLPTTVVATAYHYELACTIQKLFFNDYFRLYTQEDIIGVEIGGALKNVIAIAAGICDGLHLGDNSKAALLTRGLAEMMRIGVVLGAKVETFSGLAGIGDLIVTASSKHSRNRNFGELIAEGFSTQEALKKIGMVVEGIPTTNSARSLSIKHSVPMPISEQVYEIIYNNKSAKDALRDLLLRDPKPEIYLR